MHAALAVVLSTAVMACGNGKTDVPAQGSATVAPSASTPPPASTAVVTLTSPGVDPRVLAYAPGVIKSEICFSHHMLPSNESTPTQKERFADMEVLVCSTWRNTAAQRFAYKFKMTRAKLGDVNDASVEEAKRISSIEAAMVASPEGDAVADAQGRVSASVGGLPTRPSLPEQFQALAVPLPAQAVGIGGTWHVSDKGNIDVDYTLVALDEGGATVRWTGKQVQGLPVTTTGESTLTFDDVMPTKATFESSAETGVGEPMRFRTELYRK